MKTLAYIILFIAVLLFIGGVEINLKPFSVSLPNWRLSLWLLFLTISLSFYASHYERVGRESMLKDIKEWAEKTK